jgi:hypothetical protein
MVTGLDVEAGTSFGNDGTMQRRWPAFENL